MRTKEAVRPRRSEVDNQLDGGRESVTIELCEGLPVPELHEKLSFVHRLGESANRALAFYLTDMQERGVHA